MPTELFDLPREIRDDIWGYVVHSDESVEIKVHHKSDGTRSHYLILPWSGLIVANRTSYEEISEELQGRGRFPLVERISYHPKGDRSLYHMIHQLASSPCCRKWIESLVAEWRVCIDRCPTKMDVDDLEKRYTLFDDEVTKSMGSKPESCTTMAKQYPWYYGPHDTSVVQSLVLRFDSDGTADEREVLADGLRQWFVRRRGLFAMCSDRPI